MRWVAYGLALITLLAGAAWAANNTPGAGRRDDPGERRLDDLKRGRSIRAPGGQALLNEIRASALQEAALTYGARGGFYARQRDINQLLDREATRLDGVFPFASLLMAHHVVPPVIQRGDDTVKKTTDRQLRLADAVFTLVSPARFRLVPPDWRSYLYLPAARPEPPDDSLLPARDKPEEVALWERAIEHGWQRGIRQADRSFEVQLHRLVRDLTGMALYRELLAQDRVTPPRVTEQLLGVTDLGHTLMINDRILEIRATPRFVGNPQHWKVFLSTPYRPRQSDPPVSVRVIEPALRPGSAPPSPAVDPTPREFPWPR